MTVAADILKAPFPAFGGKSQVAELVWERLGDPRNYCEPFAFSGAMLLRRPNVGAIETINDLNCYVANFWRAVKHAPEETALHADSPVNEADLHARHRWLVRSADAQNRLQRVREEPDYFDAKIAGWWCWGACCWIGSGWCDTQQLPHLTNARGVNGLTQKLPHLDPTRGVIGGELSQQTRRDGQAIHGSLDQKRPVISADGSQHGLGINGDMSDGKIWEGRGSALQNPRHLHALGGDAHRRPQLADAFARGQGVNSNDGAGTCEQRRRWIIEWFGRLSDRLRPVRICCGEWDRICDSPSTLTRLGMTGVFLDPPYRHTIDGEENRSKKIYANDHHQDIDALCDDVQKWCLKWGADPEIRIALCGLDGEYPLLTPELGWECIAWKSRGGYGNRTEEGRENAARERIWISSACVQPTLGGLFAGAP